MKIAALEPMGVHPAPDIEREEDEATLDPVGEDPSLADGGQEQKEGLINLLDVLAERRRTHRKKKEFANTKTGRMIRGYLGMEEFSNEQAFKGSHLDRKA